MTKYFPILFVLAIASCTSQSDQQVAEEAHQNVFMSVSPHVDTANTENRTVLAVLENFLKTKNQSANENEYWLAADFDKYIYPYHDIYKIEKSKHGDDHFKPSLMELVELSKGEKLVKLGFIGITPDSGDPVIRCVYNVVAVEIEGDWKFKRAMDYNTRHWQKLETSSITYHLPKGKEPNMDEVAAQADDIERLCAFFETEPIHIDYYSCNTSKQIFEIRGFDYFPNMYFGDKGGQAGYADIIYSGNDSEEYTHEISHVYMKHLFPRANRLLEEGLATYLGGSVGMPYSWHKDKMAAYCATNDLNFVDHLDPYEQLYIDDETPIPYMIGGLVCERTLRLYGKDKLFELLSTEGELWQILSQVGLTEQNFEAELNSELGVLL